MNGLFYAAGAIAVLSTIMVITRLQLIHALLYLVVSFFAVAIVFYTLGAPFIAALEVIIYAGAIVVLLVFAVMLLNLGPQAKQQERAWLKPRVWVGPTILALALVAELIYTFTTYSLPRSESRVISQQVAMALYGTYLLGVELASMLLLAGLIGAHHLSQHISPLKEKGEE